MKVRNSFKRYILFLILGTVPVLHCINRNNPWDPVNGCPEPLREEIRNTHFPAIDSSIIKIHYYDSKAKQSSSRLDSLKDLNHQINGSNFSVADLVDSLISFNSSIDSANRLAGECNLIGTKKPLDTLLFLFSFDSAKAFHDYRDAISLESLKLAALITSGNQECTPQGVYYSVFIDSVFGIVDASIDLWASVDSDIQEFNQHIGDTNLQIIDIFNRQVRIDNNSINAYNDSLLVQLVYCGKNLLSDPDSLKTAIANLTPGDTLFLDSTAIAAQFNFSHAGDSTGSPIVIIGSPFMNTVISPSELFITASTNIRFYNLVFANGEGSGIKLESDASNILFENCVFRNNSHHGIEIIQSSLELRNCTIFHNSGSGIRIQGVWPIENRLSAENILITHNRAYGINSVSASLLISNATISDNGLDGVRLEVANQPVTIAKSILSFNEYYGVRRDNSELGQGYFTTPNTNFYGNKAGAMSADSMYIKLNIPYMNFNPYYLNKDADDYLVGEQSSLSGMDIGFQY